MRAKDHEGPGRRRRRPTGDRNAPPPSTARRQLERFWNASRDYYRLAAEANPEAGPDRLYLLSHLRPGHRVLDLGAGSCENAQWMPDGCLYLGCDLSLTALVMAAEKGRPGRRVRSDASALPLATASVDAVLSTWSLEHFHDPGRTLLETVRVLKPGGLMLLVASTWDLPYAFPPSLRPAGRWRALIRRLASQATSLLDGRVRFDLVGQPRVLTEDYVPDSDAVHVTQSWQVARFLRRAGMTIVEQQSLERGVEPGAGRRILRWFLRLLPPWRNAWGNTLIVARRGPTWREVPYRLLRI